MCCPSDVMIIIDPECCQHKTPVQLTLSQLLAEFRDEYERNLSALSGNMDIDDVLNNVVQRVAGLI